MTFEYRPARRENVPAVVGFIGSSWSGKTFSALRFATGLAGGGRIAFIDTESGRALHYADDFEFMHFPLDPPFSPMAYRAKLEEVDRHGVFDVIVTDSMSHEHAGEGGILDMHEAEQRRMGGGDNVKMLAWVKPKGEHRKLVSAMLRTRAHLVLCFRAEDKALVTKDEKGKQKVVAASDRPLTERWQPICAKGLEYELTSSVLLLADAPGVPHPVKVQAQHQHIFPEGQVVTEEAGRLMAEWAKGSQPVDVERLRAEAKVAAGFGLDRLEGYWRGLDRREQRALKPHLSDLKAAASKAAGQEGAAP